MNTETDSKLNSHSSMIHYRMPRDLNSFSRNDLNPVIDWLKKCIKPGRTLVYFASGRRIDPEYARLNYENVILVDHAFRNSLYDGKKIICLGLDAIVAVYVMKMADVKIDCFVCVNEGIVEGGKIYRYAIANDAFMGYCFPLFADRLIHIGYKGHYCYPEYFHLKKHFLDLPYSDKKEVTPLDSEYINPAIFSPHEGSRAQITILEKKSTLGHSFDVGKITVHVKHASIWDYSEELDAFFVRFEDQDGQKHIYEELESKIIDLKDYSKGNTCFTAESKKRINELCKENNFSKIGFVPNGIDYLDLAKSLSEGDNNLKEIYYFHLNKNDFGYLYKEKSMRKELDIKKAIRVHYDWMDIDSTKK